MLEPTQGHIIKAMAWDTLYYAFSIQAETAKSKKDRDRARNWMAVMDQNLENIGKEMATPDFWGNNKE